MSALSLKYFCVSSRAHVADLMAPIKQTCYHVHYVLDCFLCFYINVYFLIYFKNCVA